LSATKCASIKKILTVLVLSSLTIFGISVIGAPAKESLRRATDRSQLAEAALAKNEPGELTLAEARAYLLKLINRDRSRLHVAPLTLDDAAGKAAQLHTNDSARMGVSDHYDTDGHGPDLRYSLVGGTDAIAENNLGPYCNDQWKYELSPVQQFTRKQIEQVESGFFDESPPHDGHRKNILKAEHNRVGIGLSACDATDADGFKFRYVACCEEFVDAYGDFEKLPQTAHGGDMLTLKGRLSDGAQLYCVDVTYEVFPKAIAIGALRQNVYRSYRLPDVRVKVYWPSEAHVADGGSFQLEMPVPRSWKSGMYYFSVWVKDGKHDAFVASRQIVAIDSQPASEPLR
jgi:uncharacterized protein YkwD